MPIDAYSHCPGGTGKKVKFCCPDFVGELRKIDRLLEAEQLAACLQHVEGLLAEGRPRACLLAIKGMLLRADGQVEAARANAAAFLGQFPDNPVALAEAAILAAQDRLPEAAMERLQRALAVLDGAMEHRIYKAMEFVAEALLEEGQWHAARALLHSQMLLSDDDPAPAEKLLSLNRAGAIPLLLKDDLALLPAPQGAAWADRLEAAMKPLEGMRWQEVADRLTALSAELPDAPVVWRNLAVIRSWLADRPGAIEALRKFAAFDGPLEDAVEAESLAMLLSSDPLGDLVDLLKLTWTVRDADRLQEALLSDPRVFQVPFDPRAMAGDETPPPRLICLFLDRPAPGESEKLTLETMPRLLGEAMFFGRQTDREAWLEVLGVASEDAATVGALVAGLAGDAIDPQPRREVIAKTSASRGLLRQRWHPPQNASPEQLAELAGQDLRQAVLERWPALPLAIFGGKSPRQAAADPAEKIKLLAAIMILESWQEHAELKFDFNDLRRGLGLPPLEPLEVAETAIGVLPPVRLQRVVVQNLSDKGLVLGFRRAKMFAARTVLRIFAQEIVRRSSTAGQPERFQAYSALAQTAGDFTQALAHLDQGRRESQAAGKSCASWDLLELSFRLGRGDELEAVRLIQHVQKQHGREPGIAEALTHLLVEAGVLRPDGTAAQAHVPEEAMAAAEDPAAAEPGKLWTPDSPQSGSGGKIWTPG